MLNWQHMRLTVEQAVKGELVDPSSAQFEWPYGFIDSAWKATSGKRASGWTVCGNVNSRNRMGGYVGSVPFAAVLDKDTGVVMLIEIGSDYLARYVGQECAKAGFPSPPPSMLEPAVVQSSTGDIADELAKLAALRDKGVLTPAEFDAQKAKLLAR